MNFLFICFDDESFFILFMFVGQFLGELVVLICIVVYCLFVDGNGVIGIWECILGCFC